MRDRLLRGEDGTQRGLEKIRTLHRNANFFRQKLMEMGLATLGDWDSPVIVSSYPSHHLSSNSDTFLQPIMLYAPAKVPLLSRECFERNVAVVGVGFPATTLTTARVRICISASHTDEDLDYGLEVRPFPLSPGRHAIQVLNEMADVVHMRYRRSRLSTSAVSGQDIHKKRHVLTH